MRAPLRDRALSRFLIAVDGPRLNGEPCWLWTGRLSVEGYGRIKSAGRMLAAHRVVYEFLVGPIPGGMQIDHLCRVRACVNPDHLEPVTARENTLRGNTLAAANAAKTHCKRGHEFTTENTLKVAGGRNCLACNRAYAREWMRKRRAAERAA